MDDFRATAFHLTLWYAVLTAVASILVIALHDLGLASALLAAATLALLFALILMARAGRLSENGIMRSQFWRTLPPRLRPSEEAGRRVARRALEETWLRFARGAAMLAIVLSGCAYASNNVRGGAWAKAVGKPVITHTDSGKPAWTSQRSARLVPM
jgi:hypothetical protein